MNAYIYNADIYCEPCASTIQQDLAQAEPLRNFPEELDEYLIDSNEWPVGPYAGGGGESDTPQHCGNCRAFLENALTSDGYEYVATALADVGGDTATKEAWRGFYQAS